MPKSSKQGKKVALDWYRQLKPNKVVDVGPGVGTYAKLMRPHHNAYWTGIEVWGPYIEQFKLDELYDTVVISDVRYINASIFKADLVIIGDVIEHMPKSDAIYLINRMKKYAKNIFVSLPIIHYPQGPWRGNPYEEHKAHWEFAEIESLVEPYKTWRGNVLGYFWWCRQLSRAVSRSPGEKT